MTHNKILFVCDNGLAIDKSLINGLVADLENEGEDEPELKSLLLYNDVVTCKYPYQLPCRKGHQNCYNVVDICKYQLSELNHLIPCRTGAHLENCKRFQCNLWFKCTHTAFLGLM